MLQSNTIRCYNNQLYMLTLTRSQIGPDSRLLQNKAQNHKKTPKKLRNFKTCSQLNLEPVRFQTELRINCHKLSLWPRLYRQTEQDERISPKGKENDRDKMTSLNQCFGYDVTLRNGCQRWRNCEVSTLLHRGAKLERSGGY